MNKLFTKEFWLDISVYAFMIITIGCIIAATPLAFYNNNANWLWLLAPIIFYLS